MVALRGVVAVGVLGGEGGDARDEPVFDEGFFAFAAGGAGLAQDVGEVGEGGVVG